MQDPGAVRGHDRVAEFGEDAMRHLGRERAALVELLGECGAVDEGHRIIDQPFGLADVVDRHDRRMPQPRERNAFTPEAVEKGRRASEVGADDLDRDATVEPAVEGVVHAAEATLADELAQLVRGPERVLHPRPERRIVRRVSQTRHSSS